MSARKNPNIMRAIRLQLKSGFMKTEPPEYTFMKRYPPMFRSGQPTFHEIKTQKIPYLDLLEKAAQANPLYGESVYPAYWQDEPIGLTLAKKQYQYMQEGFDEAAAFQKAEKYVQDIESESYDSLKSLRETLREEGASAPFVNDEKLTKELLYWQDKLQKTPYDTLKLADQGELDHFIQTKILKWNEVERERRMTDPVFYKQFEKLRAQLFPLRGVALEEMNKRQIKMYRESIMSLHGVNLASVTTAGPFFLDEYVQFFAQFKAQPDLHKWTLPDRARLNSWISKTLAFSEMRAKKDIEIVNRYLKTLMHQFFPMTRKPEKAAQFSDLTVEDLKRTLYENDIGYKTEDGKVYVRRFYRIPALLFPVDTLIADVSSKPKRLEYIVSENDEEGLLQEIRKAGLQDGILSGVMAELRVYLERHKLEEPDYNSLCSSAPDFGAPDPLNNLVAEAAEDAQEVVRRPWGTSNPSAKTASELGESALDDVMMTSDSSGSGSDDELLAGSSDDSDGDSDDSDNDGDSDGDSDDSNGDCRGDGGDEENDDSDYDIDYYSDDDSKEEEVCTVTDEMLNMYKPARSQLDEDRNQMYEGKVKLEFEDAKNEWGLMAAKSARLDAEAVTRAQLEKVYQEKESARLRRIWRRNKLWKMPRPVLPIRGMLEV